MSATTGTVLSSVVTPEMCGGVLTEVTGIIPVALPVSISYISIRKGISFLLGTLRSA